MARIKVERGQVKYYPTPAQRSKLQALAHKWGDIPLTNVIDVLVAKEYDKTYGDASKNEEEPKHRETKSSVLEVEGRAVNQ